MSYFTIFSYQRATTNQHYLLPRVVGWSLDYKYLSVQHETWTSFPQEPAARSTPVYLTSTITLGIQHARNDGGWRIDVLLAHEENNNHFSLVWHCDPYSVHGLQFCLLRTANFQFRIWSRNSESSSALSSHLLRGIPTGLLSSTASS